MFRLLSNLNFLLVKHWIVLGFKEVKKSEIRRKNHSFVKLLAASTKGSQDKGVVR